MPGPIYKDSWSRTPSPSVYDIVRNPHAMYQAKRPVKADSTKDVLESTQQRLNREMLEKWHAGSFRISHDTFVVVAKVGKYMFLAVMLPPYIFFYGIPKWLLQVIFPQTFVFIKNEFFRVGRFFRTFSNRVTDLMKGLLQQTIGSAIKMFNQRARDFFRLASQQLKSSLKWVKHILQLPINRAKAPLIAWANHLKRFYRRNVTVAQTILKKGQTQSQKIYKKGIDWLKAMLHAIHQHTFHPLIQWIVPRIVSMTTKATNKAKASLKRLTKASRKATEKLSKRNRQMVQSAKTAFFNAYAAVSNQYIQPLVQWVISPLAILQTFIQGGFKKGVTHVSSKGKKLHRKVDEITAETFEFFESMIGDIAHFCSFQFISPFRRWLNKKIKQARSFNTFKEFLAHQIEMVFAKLYQRFLGWWSQFQQALSRAFKWIRDQCLSAPRRIQRQITQAIQLTFHGIRRGLYWIYWFLSFLWILFKYGMSIVHELATDFSNKSFRSK